MGSYKYEKQTINGKEYVMMSSDLFYAFFVEYMSYRTDANTETIDRIKLEYRLASLIKKKRVRLKREKILLVLMHDILLSCVVVDKVID